jgi:hypothetical protein
MDIGFCIAVWQLLASCLSSCDRFYKRAKITGNAFSLKKSARPNSFVALIKPDVVEAENML